MILSMTGFGKAVVTYKEKKITAEIKSLNSKQLDLSVKLPFVYREKELELRNLVSSELVRGKVDLYITSESNSGAEPIEIKLTMVKEYKEKQYDLLADAVRENLDMDMIYSILENGISMERND